MDTLWFRLHIIFVFNIISINQPNFTIPPYHSTLPLTPPPSKHITTPLIHHRYPPYTSYTPQPYHLTITVVIKTIWRNLRQYTLYLSFQHYYHISMNSVDNRVSTGIPGYGLRTEMIRKFFPFPLWKRFRKTGVPERFFFRKTEISGTLFRTYGSLRNSGTFRNIVPEIFRKIVPEISGFRNIWYQNYIKVLHM